MKLFCKLIITFIFAVQYCNAQLPDFLLEMNTSAEGFFVPLKSHKYSRETKVPFLNMAGNTSVNLQLSYVLDNPRFLVKSGLGYNNFNYAVDNSYDVFDGMHYYFGSILHDSVDFKNTEIEYAFINIKYLSVPLVLQYKLTRNLNKKLQFHAFTGIAAYAKVSSRANFVYWDSVQVTQAQKQELKNYYTENISPFLFSAKFGIGITQKIYKDFGFAGEIILLDYFFNSPDSRIIGKPAGFGFSGGFYYSFYSRND